VEVARYPHPTTAPLAGAGYQGFQFFCPEQTIRRTPIDAEQAQLTHEH